MNSNLTEKQSSWPDPAALRRDLPDPTSMERVQHMLEAIDRLQEISSRLTQAELLLAELPQSAGCRCFGILGEAAAGTSPAFQQAHPAVNWQRWKRYSRRLVRDYYRVNYKLLWQHRLPEALLLHQQLLEILTQEGAVDGV